MTWIGNILILCGIYYVGEKRRMAFLFTIAGEVVWIVGALRREMYDLAFICAVFGVMALVNWCKWAPKSEASTISQSLPESTGD